MAEDVKKDGAAQMAQIGDVNPSQIQDFRQLGVSGLRRFSGFVLDDFLVQLQQWRGMDLYREMAYNDADVGAMLNGIRMMCRRVPWRVEAATLQPCDQQAAEFIETCISDMSRTWNDIVDEVLFNMLPFGHAPMEICYKRRTGPSSNPSMKSKFSDGRIGWRKFEIRSPDTIWKWAFDEAGGIQGLWQMSPPTYKHTYIPIQKMLLFRASSNKNNPEGFSVLRNAYRAWYMKKNLENIEAIGAERDLAGLPVAKVPADLLSSGASPAQKSQLAAIQNIITNIRRDEQEGVVWPLVYDKDGNEMYKLELLSAPGNRQFDCDKIIQRYRQSLMMTVLADFLLLGHSGAGNRSIVEKRGDMFATAVCSFLDIIADVVNRYAIERLFELNADMQITDYPKLKHGDLMSTDLEVLGNYFKNLSATGMPIWPNPELQKHLMEAAHAPTPVDPMKIADQLEVQPRKVPEPGNTIVIPDDASIPNTNLNSSTDNMPVPGVPPFKPNTATQPFPPYPLPDNVGGGV